MFVYLIKKKLKQKLRLLNFLKCYKCRFQNLKPLKKDFLKTKI